MNEKYKLDEARYFLGKMLIEQNDRRSLAFELSAFLGAARSVLQYAYKEAKAKSGGVAWYDSVVVGDPIIGFFKGIRDANIHAMPAKPLSTRVLRQAGMLCVDEDEQVWIPYPHTPSEDVHRFADWPQDETIYDLSQRYVEALQRLVDDGIAKQIISG